MTGFLTNYAKNLVPVALGRQPIRPLLFSLYLTHRCPLNCTYCSDGQGRPFKANPMEELSVSGIKDLLAILRQATDTLDVTGGEPMVRNDLEEILSHARALGFRTMLNTKGIGLKERPELLELADILILSVDALRPDRLACIIGDTADTARQILDTLEWVTASRPSSRAKVALAAVVTPEFPEEAAAVMEFAMDHHLAFQLSPQIMGTVIHPDLREREQFRSLIDRMIRIKDQGAPILGVPSYLDGLSTLSEFNCHPLLMPTIAPNGRLHYPCLEFDQATVDLVQAGSYFSALKQARDLYGPVPHCRGKCHIFCHMALSLLQRHPLQALRELRIWGSDHAQRN